ncbi:MAG: cytochrome P450 [Rhodobacteraceae bacterium]|nr:cytochrome P450 [Paracoccaceae bacterium]MBR25356.1 cytochrome P450 [Paracoccaceae bacterium]
MTQIRERGAPVLDIDPYADAVLADPHETWKALRAAGDVVWLPRYGVYCMGRHASIRPLLKDWETFSSTGGSGLGDIRSPEAWRPASPIVEVDPPRHSHVRRVLQKILSPGMIRSWQETFDRVADEKVRALLERGGEIDGVKDFSEDFVASTFPDALGLKDSPERTGNLCLLGELNFDGQGPFNARYRATQARADEIDDWFKWSMTREAMVEGGFGAQIFEAADRGEIEPEVAPLLARSFIRGGLDTTAATISAALMHLSARPGQFDMLRADPKLARGAFDEAMRIETPIPNVCRLTMAEARIGDVDLEADAKILVILACANRDETAFEHPDEFDMTRDNRAHLALGEGVHRCIGQMIAKAEGEAALRAVARHVARIEPAGAPERRLNNNLRSLAALPLRLHAA